MRRDPTEDLDAAYIDGVAELSPDERRRVEARLAEDPAARAEHAAVRRLLDRMRAVPPEGNEPDWSAMERAIRDAVGDRVPRPWWRRWTAIAPLATAVAAALVLLVMWGRPPARTAHHRVPVLERPAPAAEANGDESIALWLDGAEVDVDPAAADALVDDDDDGDASEANDVGLLPATDLAWVDKLDDEALDRAEHWLAGKEKG